MHGKGGACVAEETATAADGTHPTIMHSCSQPCFHFPYIMMPCCDYCS